MMSIRAEELTDELNGLIEKLPESAKGDDIGADLEELVARIGVEGLESRPHVRAEVDVNSEQACSDMECSHEDECPTVKMWACLGCSSNPDEPNDEGMVWYTRWEMAEWKHHADYFAPCTPGCLHGDQFGKRATPSGDVDAAIALLTGWRSDDHELRIPDNEWGSRLAAAIDDLILAARTGARS